MDILTLIGSPALLTIVVLVLIFSKMSFLTKCLVLLIATVVLGAGTLKILATALDWLSGALWTIYHILNLFGI